MSGASECFDNRDAVYLGTSHLWDTFVTLGLELDAAVQVVLWWQLAEVLSLQKLLPWENGWCASKCWLESSVFSKERDGKSTCWCIWQSLGNALDAPKVYIYILKWVLVLVLQLELSCPRPLPNDSMFLTMSFVGSPRSSIQRILQGRDRFVLISFGAIWYNWC